MLFTFTAHAYAEDAPDRSPVLASTGVADLDQVVGGVRAGDVWVVSGPPRAGRSMLCVQLAAALAGAGRPVRFFLGRDPIHETVSRLRAHTLGRPLADCRSTSPEPDEGWVGWAMDFVPRPAWNQTDDWDVLPGPGDCCLVVDDLDMWRGDPADFLDLARSWVRDGEHAVVLAVPRHVLHEHEPATWQLWVRGADVIVSLQPEVGGESQLAVLSHRTGPVANLTVHADFDHARLTTPRWTQRRVPPTGTPTIEAG